MERATRIELALSGWKPDVLPEHFARVDRAGVEPAFSSLRTRRDNHYSNGPQSALPAIEPRTRCAVERLRHWLRQEDLKWIARDPCRGSPRIGDVQPMTSGTGESNAVSLRPKRSGLTVSLAPDVASGRIRSDAAGHVMPSTVEFSKSESADRSLGNAWAERLERSTSGVGDRRATCCTSPIWSCLDKQKPPAPGSGRAAQAVLSCATDAT